jgi:serine phosphatase RsbU (regulator of sigma subunit)
VNGYELQGISFPCYEIGGDYYDFIEREDGRLVIALGDVSGKGTAAALLMSSLARGDSRAISFARFTGGDDLRGQSLPRR